ncbi:hypothetical protein [Erwinia sp. S59]|uniref:hypothetical protein n=1 Tax=Erwinia sp. S59 TaxID=2769340 RepID=UPI00190A83C1|nr:hypothetical protein [Erwinia sp. S59]MBK0089444.1 hypothetical protein [Erwinia sp. S59]
MNSYAATMSSFADTNSALPIFAFSQNGSNRNTPVFKQRKSKKCNLGHHDDVDVLSRDNIESLLYVHVTNSIRISPSRSLTQSIVNFEKLAVSDIYSYLDKRISALKNSLLSGYECEVSEQASEDARYFLKANIARFNLIAPTVMPIPNNEVNLNWDHKEFYLDMAIVGDGTYSFYIKDKLSGEERFDDLALWDRLPSFLVEKLKGNVQLKQNAKTE